MSRHSSLSFIYPFKPPTVTTLTLQSFWNDIILEASKPSTLNCVKLKYGNSIDQDYQSTNMIDWGPEDSNHSLIGFCREYEWDYRIEGKPFEQSWPDLSLCDKILYRADVLSINSIRSDLQRELVYNIEDEHRYFSPDSIGLHIDPAVPCTLGSTDLLCVGLIRIDLSGYGYFCWQPITKYWEQIKESQIVKIIQRLCRKHFPVPSFDLEMESIQEFGELFLNKSSYQTGDWIISLHETG